MSSNQVTAKDVRREKEKRTQLNMQRGTKNARKTAALTSQVVQGKWKLTEYVECSINDRMVNSLLLKS